MVVAVIVVAVVVVAIIVVEVVVIVVKVWGGLNRPGRCWHSGQQPRRPPS